MSLYHLLLLLLLRLAGCPAAWAVVVIGGDDDGTGVVDDGGMERRRASHDYDSTEPLSIDGCVVTGDVFIHSNEDLLDLKADVEAACGEGGAWSISGGLQVQFADDIVDFLPLQNLTAINGKRAGSGYSLVIYGCAELVSIAALGNLRGALQGGLNVHRNPKLASFDGLEGLEGVGKADDGKSVYIDNNIALTSIRGLRGVRGLLPGSLRVTSNPVLASLSGLELVTGVVAKDDWDYSLRIEDNAVLCLSAPDRARFHSTRFSLADAWNSGVDFSQVERTAGCAACPADAACDGTGNGDATAPCFSVAAADSAACPATTSSNTGLIIGIVVLVLVLVVGVCYWQRVACFARAPGAVAAATAAASDPQGITIK